MTWHKEHMTGTEVLKVQTSCEAFGSHIGTPMATLVASKVATGQLSLEWDALEVASAPELTQSSSDPDGRQTDDRLPKITSPTHYADVCLDVYTHVYAHPHTHVCTLVYIQAWINKIDGVLSRHMTMPMSTYMSIHISIHMSIHMCIHLSIRLSIYYLRLNTELSGRAQSLHVAMNGPNWDGRSIYICLSTCLYGCLYRCLYTSLLRWAYTHWGQTTVLLGPSYRAIGARLSCCTTWARGIHDGDSGCLSCKRVLEHF